MIKETLQVKEIKTPQEHVIWLMFYSYKAKELKLKFTPGFQRMFPLCSFSTVIRPTHKSGQSSQVSLAVSDGGSGRIIFNHAMKNSLTFKAEPQPILPQVACGFGLGKLL